MTNHGIQADACAARSCGASHFERLYAASDDPWHFRTSPYERKKYAATLAALPSRRFASALEVGCSIGELTSLLATRCNSLIGIDIAEAPLVTARARWIDMPHVEFRRMAVPDQFPDGPFDLIVLSEILYFLSPNDVRAVAAHVCDKLRANGVALLVNYLGHVDGAVTDDPQNGETAARGFLAAASPYLMADLQEFHNAFRIDRLSLMSQANK